MTIGRKMRVYVSPALKSYSTNFATTESPISEGGKWFHTSNAWANIITVASPNRAVGTQTGTPTSTYNDSYAYLAGFKPNVSAQATIYKDVTIDTVSGMHEVELLLRWSDSGTQVQGYECNFSSIGGYAEIVRWNGNIGDFTILADAGAFTAPVTGDIVRVTISGGTITTFISRLSGGGFVQLAQATDSTFTTGQPGFGMWLQDAAGFANQQKFAFTSYSVTEI